MRLFVKLQQEDNSPNFSIGERWIGSNPTGHRRAAGVVAQVPWVCFYGPTVGISTGARLLQCRRMATQAERRATTVTAITRAAKSLFAEHGFDRTSVDDIVAKAGVAKGAFYHHFPSKEQVFTAVLDELQQALSMDVIAAAMPGSDALDRLKRGTRAFLVACCKPAVRRIVLIDGPAVIGWEAWRALDARYFGALTRQAVEDAMTEDLLARRPVEPLVQLLVGAVTEAAMVCARSSEPKRTVSDLMAGLDALLHGLRKDVTTPRRRAAPRR